MHVMSSSSGASLFTRILAIVGGLTLLAAIGAAIVALFWFRTEAVPDNTIVEIDLERQVVEHVPGDPTAQAVLGRDLTLMEIVDAIEKAKTDDQVSGLFVRVGNETLGPGTVEELRAAVKSFREAGKPAVLFSETFGEVSPGRTSYYLATAFDEIYMQPSGDLGLVGFSTQSFFLQNALEEWGIEPEYDHRHEYKSAKYLFTEEDYTDPHREADRRVMESTHEEMVQGIADGRDLTVEEVEALIEAGPYYGQEAVEAGLVDDLRYRDEVFAQMREDLGDDAEFLYLSKYRERAGSAFNDGDDVALIYGTGMVVRGESGFSPLTMGASMGAETVTRAFRTAVEDEVEAIIFRIDSPGGSYVASDAIWREVRRARDAGIPVIATMGDVAGSGGYFVAMGADQIVAQPSTVTGSIGVVGGKFLTDEFWDDLGINWSEMSTTESATMWSSREGYTDHTSERFQAWLDRVYDDFTAKAAEGRGMSQEELDEVARGRIWSGRDAHERGLVDELGGFHAALDLAREAAGLEEDAPINLRTYPAEKSFIEQLMDEGLESGERAATVRTVYDATEPLHPMLRTLHHMSMSPGERALHMPGHRAWTE